MFGVLKTPHEKKAVQFGQPFFVFAYCDADYFTPNE